MKTPTKSARIVGCLARLQEPVSAEPWQPLTRAAVQALAPLPLPPPRGWQVNPAVATTPAAPSESPAAPPAPASATAAPPPDVWNKLRQVPAQQLAPLLAHEHPQTIALVLSQLEPAQAAGILNHLPEPLPAEVVLRIATMETVTPKAFEALKAGLERGLRDILGGEQEAGGPKVVAGILNLAGASAERKMLEQLHAQSPQVAELVRNLMFDFGDLARMSDHDIQVLLREVDQKDLVLALKGAGEELTERILSNMSERVRVFITEEMAFIGSVRQSEVEQVQQRIVQQVHILQQQGQLAVVCNTEDPLVG